MKIELDRKQAKDLYKLLNVMEMVELTKKTSTGSLVFSEDIGIIEWDTLHVTIEVPDVKQKGDK